jgi:proline iminopeptidase
MDGMYDPIEPYDAGELAVGDGQRIYWETCGNPRGIPAVVLHGGPGSGCTPLHRRLFDPNAFRIVLLDQRNCGRSTPAAADPSTDLSTNTTDHLIEDLERLRRHLGIDRWLVLGGSWGTTLGLAYAQRHPDVVRAMVLIGVALCGSRENEWLYGGARAFFPDRWTEFTTDVPHPQSTAQIFATYAEALSAEDEACRVAAARRWNRWESALVSVQPTNWDDEPADFNRLVTLARLCTHYFSHHAWLEEGELLRGATSMGAIPGTLIHGRFDLGVRVEGAWQLSRAWPGSRLVIVDTAGHSVADPGMGQAVIQATDSHR